MDLLWNLDNSLFRTINVGWHQPWLDPIFWALSYSGLGQVQAIAVLCLLFAKRLRGWVAPLLLAEALTGLVFSAVLKILFDRDRPSNLPYAIVQEDFHAHGFPSGHTTTSFAIAFMLLFLTCRTSKPWIGWLALVWASAVGVSRIYRGVHWPTDVLGGACLGLAGAALIWLIFNWGGWLPETDAAATVD